MQVTIDSAEPLERVLPVINALYGVSLLLPEPSSDTTNAPPKAARRSRSSKAASGQPTGRRNKRTVVAASAVRDWARSNGYEVSSRGRLSAGLIDAYRAAN
jgi:hypothetical protein